MGICFLSRCQEELHQDLLASIVETYGMSANTKNRFSLKKFRKRWKPYYQPVYAPVRKLADTITFTRPDKQWTRVIMDQETLKLVSELSPSTMDVLEISGNEWGHKLPFRSYKSAHFPDFDICESATPEKYDLIIAEQVFEHLLWPYRAAKNVLEMLNPNGYFLVTVPFLIRYHRCPNDCTRWTETGIKHFLAECGFPLESIITGSWGNRSCVKGNFRKWTRYRPWQHSLKNDPLFPVNVWALARKCGGRM